MTKKDFLATLETELRRKNVSDAADIIEEYTQHFDFKLSDGYSEEEIAAKLGDPKKIAAQYEPEFAAKGKRSAVLTRLWLAWADLFFGLFSIFLLSFGVVLAVSALSFGVVGLCLIFNLGALPFVTLPSMPYLCGAILGVCLSALCVLTVCGCVWFFAFIRRIFKAYGRFHQNMLAPCKGAAALPPLPVLPQFSAKKKRRLRSVALISLVIFAAFFVISYIICSLWAGSLQFWHVWGWFANAK